MESLLVFALLQKKSTTKKKKKKDIENLETMTRLDELGKEYLAKASSTPDKE